MSCDLKVTNKIVYVVGGKIPEPLSTCIKLQHGENTKCGSNASFHTSFFVSSLVFFSLELKLDISFSAESCLALRDDSNWRTYNGT